MFSSLFLYASAYGKVPVSENLSEIFIYLTIRSVIPRKILMQASLQHIFLYKSAHG